MKISSKINREWHKNNKMPKNPSFEERVKWHLEHQKYCKCREMSEKLLKEINRCKRKKCI